MSNTEHTIDTFSTNVEKQQPNNSNSSESNEIFHRTEIEGTPFQIIEYPSEVFLALGRFKIKRQHENGKDFTPDDYKLLVLTRDWNLILDIVGFFIQQSK